MAIPFSHNIPEIILNESANVYRGQTAVYSQAMFLPGVHGYAILQTPEDDPTGKRIWVGDNLHVQTTSGSEYDVKIVDVIQEVGTKTTNVITKRI